MSHSVGSNTWWTLVKERQGLNNQETIFSLSRSDETCATRSREKTELLAKYFAGNMIVEEPRRPPPRLEQEAAQKVTAVEVTREKVHPKPSPCRLRFHRNLYWALYCGT